MKYNDFSDVLIIGGGFAGMYAAIAAAEAKKNVTILCKSKTGGSGNSVVAMSVHRFPPEAPKLQSEYRERFLKSGAGEQNVPAVNYYIENAAQAIEQLQAYNFPLEYRCLPENGKEYPYLACCHPKQGQILTKAIRQHINTVSNIHCIDDVTALDIVVSKGKAIGVLALQNQELIAYPAKSIIIATGGAGNIYSATSNTSDVTGDGFAMAARCGLQLQGMEFVQFYPYRIYSPARADIFPDVFEHGAIFRNENGIRFMDNPRYPKKELENRDVVARAMFDQQEVHLDLSECDMNYLEQECPNIAAIYKNHPNKPLLLRPVAHFFMGGIPLRPDCSTDIPGLYACGEVTGGLHGANRLAGSALSEAVLFGRTAGINAAKYSEENALIPIQEEDIQKLTSTYPILGTDDLRSLKKHLQEIMWENASVVRSKDSLNNAIHALQSLQEQFKQLHPTSLKKWAELRNLLFTAQQVVSAAISRKESLGAHYIVSNN